MLHGLPEAFSVLAPYSYVLWKRVCDSDFYLLTDVREKIIEVLNLQPMHNSEHQLSTRNRRLYPYYYIDTDTGRFNFYIFAKGQGLFTERFESELLSRRVIKDLHIYQPDQETDFWLKMYIFFIHGGQGDPTTRKAVLNQMRQRLGLFPKPKWDDIGYHPGEGH